MPHQTSHWRAVCQALFVTFLWSTSWVFIKIGLKDDLPALTFAGLRYTLAFLCLLPFVLRNPALRSSVRDLPRRSWCYLIILGLVYYAVNQGAQFLGLAVLPTTVVNLLLSFTTVVVTLLSACLLVEQPTRTQWTGVTIYAAGVLVYFYPVVLPANQLAGIVIVIVGMLANTAATLIGRKVNREQHLYPLVVTVVSMGFGSLTLLIAGILTQGFPALTITQWTIIGWLAIVNTALAFTLWNHTLRTLSATESSIINNAMLIQIPILAWIFLGEAVTLKAGVGIALAAVGILIVQLRGIGRLSRSNKPIRVLQPADE